MFAWQKLLTVLGVLFHILPHVCLHSHVSQWKFSACGIQVPHIFCLSKSGGQYQMDSPENWHTLSSQVSKYSWRSASTAPTSARDQGTLDMIKRVYASAGSPALLCPTRHKPQTAAAQGAALGQTSLIWLQLQHGHSSHHLSMWGHKSSGNMSEGFVRWGLSTAEPPVESEYFSSQHDFLGASCLRGLLLLQRWRWYSQLILTKLIQQQMWSIHQTLTFPLAIELYGGLTSEIPPQVSSSFAKHILGQVSRLREWLHTTSIVAH